MNNNGLWRPLDAWPESLRPAMWKWLQQAGSLTKILRAAAGPAFHVRVVHEGQNVLDVEDAQLLHAQAGISALERRVYLCADEPWVYALTLALTRSKHWLDSLGDSPLGERVFAQADAQRSSIQVARLENRNALYLAAVSALKIAPPMLWARRSVLLVGGHRLLIYECFLPGMRP